MTDVLIIGDTFRSPGAPPRGAARGSRTPSSTSSATAPGTSTSARWRSPRIRGVARDIVVHPLEEIGIDELYAQGLGWLEVRLEWAARAAAHAGLTQRRRARHVSRRPPRPARGATGVELTVDQARVRRAPPRQGRRRARRHPARAARRRGGPRGRRLAAAAGGERRRRALARRRAADGRAGQGGDAAGLRRARLHGRGLHRRARAAGRGRPRDGPRADPVRRAGRLRPLAARRRLLLLRRHDPHVRRRAGVAIRCASGTR